MNGWEFSFKVHREAGRDTARSGLTGRNVLGPAVYHGGFGHVAGDSVSSPSGLHGSRDVCCSDVTCPGHCFLLYLCPPTLPVVGLQKKGSFSSQGP